MDEWGKQTTQTTANGFMNVRFAFQIQWNNWMNSELIFTITKTNEQNKKTTHISRLNAEKSEWAHVDANSVQKLVHGWSKWKTECASRTPSFRTGRQLKKTIWQVPLFIRATFCSFQTGSFFVCVNEWTETKHTQKTTNRLLRRAVGFSYMKPAKPTTIVRGPRIHTYVCAPHRFFWIC